jgi:futalosine hydrolase
MRILVVGATAAEVQDLSHSRHTIETLITGVGMVATAAACSRALAGGRFDLALNFGVCGSFDRALGPGAVVHVVSDRIAELGAEDGDVFLSLADLDLPGQD